MVMLSQCGKHCVYIVNALSHLLFSLAVCGLWFGVWAFSSFVERGLYSLLQRMGFSCCEARALGHTGFSDGGLQA